MIIALDGLAGSGKGTIARNFARTYDFTHIDAGLIFRATTFALSLNSSLIYNVLWKTNLLYQWDLKSARVYFEGIDITDELRKPEIAKRTAEVSSVNSTFVELVSCTRFVAKSYKNVICDGRSVATDIFPDCDLAFVVKAGLTVRAFRRWKDLKKIGVNHTYPEVRNSIALRDEKDSSRVCSPFQVGAKDIHVLRSDVMSVSESVACVHDAML